MKLVREKEERKKIKFKPTTQTRTSWNDTINSRTMETYRRSKCVMITRKEIAKTFIRSGCNIWGKKGWGRRILLGV